VAVDLGHAIRAARVERRRLALRHFDDLAEHLAGAGLIHADVRVNNADGVEHAGDAQRGHVAGENRLVPRGLHERLRGQIIDFLRPVLFQDVDERNLVAQVAGNQLQPVLNVADAVEVKRAGAAHHADDAVAAVEEELGQIGTILAGDTGNQCCRHSNSLTCDLGAGPANVV